MKQILHEFVEWMEDSYGKANRGATSQFAIEPPPETMVMAEIALEAGLNNERPVVLATNFPLKSIIGALVLHRADVKLEHVFQGALTDEQFESLTDVVAKISKSKLLIESPDIQIHC